MKKLELNALGKILVKSKHHNKNEIVNISLWLQIINLIYVMIYVINSIIDSFFYPNKLFYYFNIVSLIMVGICSFVAIIVIDVRYSK